jgi:hypothetical protein
MKLAVLFCVACIAVANRAECDTLVTLGQCDTEPETMQQSCPGFCTQKSNSILAADNEEVHESPKIISVEEVEGETSDSDYAGTIDEGEPAKKVKTDEGEEGVAAKQAFKKNVKVNDHDYAIAREEASNLAYANAEVEHPQKGSRGNFFTLAVLIMGALLMAATAWTRYRPDLWRGGPDLDVKQEVRYQKDGQILSPVPGSIL